MSLILKQTKKQFEIPKPGPVTARLTEIKDLGIVETKNGPKDKVRFVWSTTTERSTQGESFKIFQSFSKSLHPMSYLFKTLRQITGENPTDGFNLVTLIGTEVQLIIQHNERDGVVYANVAAIIPLPTPEEKPSQEAVARVVERLKENMNTAGTGFSF